MDETDTSDFEVIVKNTSTYIIMNSIINLKPTYVLYCT